MEKSKLLNFINKYHLSGVCNQAKIKTNGEVTSTTFVSDNRSLLGIVGFKNLGLPEGEFGVFNTAAMVKIIQVMDDLFEGKFLEERKKIVSLHLNDSRLKSNIMLADLEIIPDTPEIKFKPDADVSARLTLDFCQKVIKTKSALANAENIGVKVEDGKLLFISNYSDHAMDTITVTLDEVDGQCNIMSFSLELISNIFENNKDFTEAKVEISNEGLMTFIFTGNEFTTKYLLVRKNEE